MAALNCSLAGLCDGYLLGTDLVEDKTQCIYFCREKEVGNIRAIEVET